MLSASRWLRVTLWCLLSLAGLVGLYSAAGFYLAPYLVQTRLWPLLEEQLGGQWSATEVRFNPFELTLAVSGFALRSPDGGALASVAALNADVDVGASLRQRALVASGILQQPQVAIALGKGGVTNFAFLLGPPEASAPEEPPGVFPFRVVRLAIEQGEFKLDDQSGAQPFHTALSPLNFAIENLSSTPGEAAHFDLAATGTAQEGLAAQGSLGLSPTVSDGEITVKDFPLASLAPYLSALEPYRILDGKLSVRLHYQLRSTDSGTSIEVATADADLKQFRLAEGGNQEFLQIAAAAAKGFSIKPDLERPRLSALSLRDITVQSLPQPGLDGKGRAIRVGSLRIGDVAVNVLEQSLTIGQVESDTAEVPAWLAPDGAFGVPGMPPPAPATPQPSTATPAAEESPWHMTVASLALRQYQAAFTDFSVVPPVAVTVGPLSLDVSDFNSAAGSEFKVKLDTVLSEKGRAEIEGKVAVRPLLIADLRLVLENVALPWIQPYLDKAVGINLNRGRLDVAGDFDYYQGPVDSIRFSGEASVHELVTSEKRGGKELLNWKDLQLNGLTFETIPKRLSIREVIVTEPYANVVIRQDGMLNLAQALTGPGGTQAPPTAAAKPDARQQKAAGPAKAEPGEALPVVIGALRINQGRADFADHTLKPITFAVGIHELSGNVRGLSSQADAKADVHLEGKIEQNSPVKIIGKINPFSMEAYTDIVMQFRNVNLTTLSPYSGKFAGYRIEKGKMSVDLRYRLDKGRLLADNRFLLDQLTLGEPVESPEATSLPVKLAIALLKDADGQIDLDIPISGDLRDPNVSIRSLLASAATQLVTKLIRAPFALLGSLVGDGDEALDSVDFAAGSSQLSASEQEKLAKVAKALKERPALGLEIKGAVNPEQDKPALAEQELMRQLRFMKRIELRMQGKPVEGAEEADLSDEDYRRLLTEYCRAKLPNIPELQTLDEKNPLLGDKALKSAQQRVLQKLSVSELALRRLGQARGQTVRNYFVKEAGIAEGRVFLLDIRFAGPEEKQIKVELSLGSS